MRSLLLFLLLLGGALRDCDAVFRVVAPVVPGSSLGVGIEHQAALFGPLAPARSVVAPLVLAPEANRKACDAFNRSQLVHAEDGRGNTSAGADAGDAAAGDAFVLLVERGDCHFADKVRHAQDAAAAGVVVFNSERDDDSGALAAMADDGSAGDIRIPSVLIRRRDALELLGLLQTARTTIVMLNREERAATHAAQRDFVVDVALWSSSRSPPAMRSFVKTFAVVARAIDAEDDEKARVRRTIRFTPYFDVFEGSAWGCNAGASTLSNNSASSNNAHPCDKLCLYNSRFCAFDPERDSTVGLDGKDVLEEDVRQLCVAQYAREATTRGDNALFLDYAAAFNDQCSPPGDVSRTSGFNDACSRQVLATLGIPAAAVAKCVREQGEALLAAQIAAKREFGVFAVPQFAVNGEPLRADTALVCDEPISPSSCPPLRQLCVGFEERMAQDAATTLRACSAAFWRDDVCFAPLERDDCGECTLRADPTRWNRECTGCDGVPHSGKDLDACGVCGGAGSFDACGRCLPRDDPQRGRSCVDCKGVPNGGAKVDACGRCDGRGSFDACGLCLDAHDPRRQSAHCRVDNDPDAVRGKAQIAGVSWTGFRGPMLAAFQRAVGAAAHVNATDVVLKSVVDASDARNDTSACTEVYFFVPCPDDACRVATAKLLQDPSASLTVAMTMRAHLDDVTYGLNAAASVERVRLHSIASASSGVDYANDSDAVHAPANSRGAVSASVGVVLGALCFLTLAIGFTALRARDNRIRREFQQMFAAYTPLTSLDQEDERESNFP
ncbi:hypothetical protein PybrP1_008460 [[Pythium] brassicae (nom. inval.)]|nr:hypothetical protein PybrP1_008460 [[Pythium] brassicae (nom. inval.)]